MAEAAGALERASKLYAGGHISDSDFAQAKGRIPDGAAGVAVGAVGTLW